MANDQPWADGATSDGARRLVLLDQRLSRMMDVVIASVALLCFAPLMVVIALLIYLGDPGPVFFAQWRIGRDGKRFRCLKFRSMAIDSEVRLQELLSTDAGARAEWARDHKLRNDPRVTGIGRFLRKSSLDELPQFLNVLMGQMSVVGPRPIVDAEAARYGRYIVHYCSVRPGITGLWQVSGRNDTSYRRRVAFDVAYSRNRTMMMDLGILVKTVPSVIFARGSY